MDCLLTMFNILLIIAGILEYILLGIDFKVPVSLLICVSTADPHDRIAFRTHTLVAFLLGLPFSMRSCCLFVAFPFHFLVHEFTYYYAKSLASAWLTSRGQALRPNS